MKLDSLEEEVGWSWKSVIRWACDSPGLGVDVWVGGGAVLVLVLSVCCLGLFGGWVRLGRG